MGLSFYTEADAAFFFGRDAERQVIMGNLRASRLTLLYAESGVGKSSLLRAGVAARLRELAQHVFFEGGSACYVPIVFSSWRDDPVEDLIGEIEDTTRSFLDLDLEIELPRHSLRGAIEAAVLALDQSAPRDRSDRPATTLLIILDQFEEYFLYGPREARVGRMADELADCINHSDPQANFLISIRDDAYSALGDLLKGRMSNVYGNYLHLEYLDADAACEAIEKPIERYNSQQTGTDQITIEPGLVESVLAQVRRERDGGQRAAKGSATAPAPIRQQAEIITPYLELVMTTLWERERCHGSHTLRLSTLEELHGAEEIVGSHLEKALNGLGSLDRELAVDVLHHLVTPSGTKIALEVGDLSAYTHYPPEAVATVLNKLTGQARILREVPPAPGKPSDNDTYRRFEIYHDVLARPINDAVGKAATRRLEHEKEAAEESARQERGRARVFRALAAVAFALVVVAVAAVVLATVETSHARRAQRTALSRELAGQALADFQSGALARGTLLSLEAYRTANTADARTSLVRALEATRGKVAYMTGHTGAISSVAFSPDGRELASGSEDQTVIVADVKTSRPVAVLRGHTAPISSVAFSPDGSTLASASADGTVILWNPRSGQRLRTLRVDGDVVQSVAFSPDGKLLGSAGDRGTVILWNPRTGRRLRTLRGHAQPVYSLAFAPDGRVLASAGADHSVILWNSRSGRRLRTVREQAAINSVAFSRDGKTLALASDDHTVVVCDIRTGRTVMVLRGHGDAAESVAYSPNGTTLASGSNDDTTILWDANSGRRLNVLGGHTASVSTVAFSPDGQLLASGSYDDSVILWGVHPAHGLRTLIGHRGDVLGVAFSPDGKMLAFAGRDRTIIVWDVSTGQRLKTLLGHRDAVESVAFSPNGRVLASGSADHTVMLWDVATGKRIGVLRGHSDVVYAVSFSPDGSLLASAGADHAVILWGTSTGRRLRTLFGHTDAVNAVAFSPSGRTLASAGNDDSVIVWDVATGDRQHTLGAQSPVASVAFSPDGKALVSAGVDRIVTLWDANTGKRLGDPLVGHQDSITSVAVSPNSKLIASGGGDSNVILWNLATRLGEPIGGHVDAVMAVAFSPDGQTVASGSRDHTVTLSRVASVASGAAPTFRYLCSVVRRNLTQAEWHALVPDAPYRRTCPQ